MENYSTCKGILFKNNAKLTPPQLWDIMLKSLHFNLAFSKFQKIISKNSYQWAYNAPCWEDCFFLKKLVIVVLSSNQNNLSWTKKLKMENHGRKPPMWTTTTIQTYRRSDLSSRILSWNKPVNHPTSYFGPADITEQLASVQNSVIVPYNIFI